ncbi:MAG: hypothetical protein ABI406_05480 [Ktedonobacteraceae bacterium]
MTAWINPRNERVRRLLTGEGFLPDQRSVVEMKVKLNQYPQLVKSTIEESFDRPFTHWDQAYTNRTNFDPTLWHLAWDGEQLAGVLLGAPNPTLGWVDQLEQEGNPIISVDCKKKKLIGTFKAMDERVGVNPVSE